MKRKKGRIKEKLKAKEQRISINKRKRARLLAAEEKK
jgi:hypothetical protein